MAQTLLDKIWDAHEVAPGLLYIDLHLVHEVTSPQAFEGLRLAGRTVRRPDRTLATADHNVPTDGTLRGRDQGRALARPGADAGAQLRGVRDPDLFGRFRPSGHRSRDRPRVGRDATRHDDRLRRLAHRDPRRVRCAGVRHRHERGRACPRDAVHGADQAAFDAHQLRRAGGLRRHREGPDPRDDRSDRRRRCRRTRRRVQRPGHRRALHGGPHDGLQHDHRGRRAGRNGRPRRSHLRVVRAHRAPRHRLRRVA